MARTNERIIKPSAIIKRNHRQKGFDTKVRFDSSTKIMSNFVTVTNLLTLLAVGSGKEKCSRNNVSVGKVVEYVLRDYDQHLLPDPEGVNVTLEIHVQEIGALSEITSDFELDIMYSEIWTDQRLDYSNLSMCITNLTLKSSFRSRIWTPDTCIINSKSAEIHESPSENTFIILYQDGMIWANFRMKVKAPCRMNLIMFPFDMQQCSLIFESYSFNNDQVRLQWHTHAITMMGPVELPDFSLRTWKTNKMTLPYPNGNWDRLNVTFTFTRRSGYYLFQAYFPTLLTVLSSWIGFLLDVRSVSARITLGVSSLLAISFQFGTVLRHLPRVSYIKCLDVWMIACVIFIFLTIVELGVICQITRFEKEAEMSTKCLIKWLENVRRRRGATLDAGLTNGSLQLSPDPSMQETQFVQRTQQLHHRANITASDVSKHEKSPTAAACYSHDIMMSPRSPPSVSITPLVEDSQRTLLSPRSPTSGSSGRAPFRFQHHHHESHRQQFHQQQQEQQTEADTGALMTAVADDHFTTTTNEGGGPIPPPTTNIVFKRPTTVQVSNTNRNGRNGRNRNRNFPFSSSRRNPLFTAPGGVGGLRPPPPPPPPAPLPHPDRGSPGFGQSFFMCCCRRFNITAKRVDEFAVVGFPIIFGLFNLIYWSYYLGNLQKIE